MSRIVLVLGATSAIATAYCRLRAESGASLVLVARNAAHLDAIADDLRARGVVRVVAIISDLAEMTNCQERLAGFCQVVGMPDEILIAYGQLDNRESGEMEVDEVRQLIDVNFTSAALWLQAAAKLLSGNTSRTLIVIGSVAGDRGRRSNYVYGAAKAAIDTFAEGLAHRLHGSNLHVLTVKPGFVDTPMTAHLDRSGLLWAQPEQIAASIDKAVRRRRRELYAPWFWRPIMLIIRAVPRRIFYRTKL